MANLMQITGKSPLAELDETPHSRISEAYNHFIAPLDNGPRGGFDIHIYHFQNNPVQAKYARELYNRIRQEFPELQVGKFWDCPAGPHPVATFEVDVLTPAQFGAFIPWLVVWRGPLSALVHPNTLRSSGEGTYEANVRDHTSLATWMGPSFPLDLDFFVSDAARQKKAKQQENEGGPKKTAVGLEVATIDCDTSEGVQSQNTA